MKRIFKLCHRYLYLLSVLFSFVLLYPCLYYFSRNSKRYATLNKFRRAFAWLSSAGAGIFYRFSYEKPIDWSRTYIICANHSSNLDITAVTRLIKPTFAFLGKDELLNNPVTGLFFKTIDIPINRESRMSSFRAFKRADEYLKQGISVVIFPEGRITDHYPPQLSDFKNGPFRLAIENKVPIIPVSILDAWEKMWDDGVKYGSRPGICHICVHAPLETSGLTLEEADVLKARVHSIISGPLTANK